MPEFQTGFRQSILSVLLILKGPHGSGSGKKNTFI